MNNIQNEKFIPEIINSLYSFLLSVGGDASEDKDSMLTRNSDGKIINKTLSTVFSRPNAMPMSIEVSQINETYASVSLFSPEISFDGADDDMPRIKKIISLIISEMNNNTSIPFKIKANVNYEIVNLAITDFIHFFNEDILDSDVVGYSINKKIELLCTCLDSTLAFILFSVQRNEIKNIDDVSMEKNIFTRLKNTETISCSRSVH